MNSEILVLTARLLRYLEIQEEEALVGTIKFGRTRKDKEETGSRFQRSPNFGFPAACDERPVSADGRITIHFKQVVVVKKATYKGERRAKGSTGLVIKGDPEAPEVSSSSAMGPSDHDSYITRDDAVMTITAASFDGYMAAGKLEQGQKAVISNISNDPKKRKKFWDAVVRRERKPSADVITLYPDRLTLQQWSDVAVALQRGHPLKRLINAAVKSRLLMDTGALDEAAPVSFEIDGCHFAELCARLNKITTLDRCKLPAALRRGRGGRVQRRFVAELSAGISEAARLEIACGFAEYLKSLGMMYTVVIHAPDHHNHRRNFHLHAVAYDRPCRYLVEHGCWDFDYAVPVPGQYKRFRFPERQDKPGKLTRSTDGVGDFRVYGAAQMAAMRQRFTALCNKQLRRMPLNYLYDHRSYKVLNIPQEPGRHLGTKAASLGGVGVPVDAFIENAERSWQGAFNRARAAHRARLDVRSDCRIEASVMLARFEEFGGEGELARSLAGEIGRLDALTHELGEQELHLENLRLTLNMVTSSAEKTEETCTRLLEAIETGAATPSEQAMEGEIRRRLREADAFQQRIYDAELKRIQQAGEFAKVLQGKTTAIEQTMERIRKCIDAMEAQISREPSAGRAAEEVPAAGIAPKKVDPRARRIRTYYEAPLDYEESWDNVFSRIHYEEMEVRAPTTATPVYHVPGISRDELDLLLNPIFHKRSQARLKEMHKYQELNRQRREERLVAEPSVEVDANEPVIVEPGPGIPADRPVEPVQQDDVPTRTAATEEGVREHSGPTAPIVEKHLADLMPKCPQPDAAGQEVSHTEDKAEQSRPAQVPRSDIADVREAFEKKLSRGTKRRSETSIRNEVRERGEDMTTDEASAVVSGVVRTSPERRQTEQRPASAKPAWTQERAVEEPRSSATPPIEETPSLENAPAVTPSSPDSGGEMTPEEQWEWLKSGGRGR